MKTLVACLLGFILGILLMLMLRTEKPQPVATVCPSPEPCPTCNVVSRKTHAPARPKKAEPPPADRPLPELADDTDAHRERLRDWFAEHGQGLTVCRPDGEPRRQLLMQMKIETDGVIADAALLGAADLPQATAACVMKKVRELRVPVDHLRGRETVLIHLAL